MTLALIAVGLTLAAFVLMTILWPMLEKQKRVPKIDDTVRRYERLVYERDRLLENMADLELDLSLKKIEPQDYEDLKENILQDAARVYGDIDALEKQNPLFVAIEKDLAQLKL